MKNANEHINILYLKFEPSERYEDHSSYVHNLIEHCIGIAEVMGSNPVQT